MILRIQSFYKSQKGKDSLFFSFGHDHDLFAFIKIYFNVAPPCLHPLGESHGAV